MSAKYTYSLRIAIIPKLNEDENFKILLDFCLQAGIDDVAFFLCAEEFNDGHITIEQARPYVEMLRRNRAPFDAAGITISLNPWYTLSHGDRFQAGTPCKYNTMVDPNGYESIMTACPTDQTWLSDFIELYKYLIYEINPNVIWLEDDFRLHNHEPMAFGGCFCKEHMRLYNQFMGGQFTRLEFVEGMRRSDGQDFRTAYAFVNRTLFNQVSNKIGKALPNVRIGLMTSDARMYQIEGRDQKTVFQNFAVYKQGVNRLHLSSYRERSTQKYAFDTAAINLLEEFYTPKQTAIWPEIENFPHGPMSKSAAFVRYQILSSLGLGAEGITLSVFDFCGNGVNPNWGYAPMLREIKPFLNTVASLNLRHRKQYGIKVLVSESAPLCNHKKAALPNEAMSNASYFAGYLQLCGISTVFCDDINVKDSIVAVCDDVLYALTNQQIIWLFENNCVLLDGESVRILCEKELGWLINALSCEPQPERKGDYSYEQSVDKDAGLKRASALFFCGVLHKIIYGDDSKAITELFNPRGEFFCNGITRCGKHLVIPFYNKEFAPATFAQLRVQIIKNYLMEVKAPSVILSQAGVSPFVLEKDGERMILLINCTDDSVDCLRILNDAPEARYKVTGVCRSGSADGQISLAPREVVLVECLPPYTI